jgi:hypothetical protein
MVMKPVQDGAAGQKIAGSVFCITEYDAASSPLHNSRDGIRANQLAHLPMSSAHSVAERYRSAHIRDFSREKDFIRLMPKLSELDVNDPRNEHLVCMLLAAGGVITGRTITLSSAFSGDKEIFRLATDEYGLLLSEQGVSYANYLKFQQGIRIKLLQLRTKKPFLFSEPIPLAEAVLKRSDLYKSLLHSAYKGDSTENGKIVIETPKGTTTELFYPLL